MPIARYTSPEVLRDELARLWPRVWQCAGLAIDVAEPGDYFTYELADQSYLVVRGADRVRAFHNVCRHRGRSIVEPGRGHLDAIRCPLHQWTYALDGALREVPSRERFPQLRSLSSFDLREVAVEVFAGLVFVNPQRDAPPLAAFLGEIGERLRPFHLDEYVPVADHSIEVACNWKLSIDLNQEGYHVPMIHPELREVFDARSVRLERLGPHSYLTAPFGDSRGEQPPGPASPLLRMFLREAGADADRFSGTVAMARQQMQHALRERRDFDLSGLSDEQLVDHQHFFLFPNLTLNLTALQLIIVRQRPDACDPARTRLDQMVLKRVPTGAPRPARVKSEDFGAKGSLGFITDQDVQHIVALQRGARSAAAQELVLGEDEDLVAHFHETIADYLAR